MGIASIAFLTTGGLNLFSVVLPGRRSKDESPIGSHRHEEGEVNMFHWGDFHHIGFYE